MKWRGCAISVYSLAVGALMAFSRPVNAQAGWVVGIVLRDSSGHVLQGARIDLPGSNRSATSNAMGEFRINDVPIGRQPVLVRHAGFAPLADTIDVTTGTRSSLEYIMSPTPVGLDSVVVKDAAPTARSPGLQEFEERRRTGAGGSFITSAMLRANDDRSFIDVLSRYIPGIRRYQPDPVHLPNAWYISSTRKCGDGGVILTCAKNAPCPLALYLDGVPLFLAGPGGSNTPDLSTYSPQQLAAVEVFLGGASLPPKYNVTGNGCGVMLLWTRER